MKALAGGSAAAAAAPREVCRCWGPAGLDVCFWHFGDDLIDASNILIILILAYCSDLALNAINFNLRYQIVHAVTSASP